MELIQHAKELAKQGLRVFPLAPMSKVPPKGFTDFAHRATTDFEKIEKWWKLNPNYNIGISTEELVAIDIDNKSDKKGSAEVARLQREGKIFPETFEQITPTSGHHLLYSTGEPIRQGVNVLGPGIDIRASGGYVVGCGSRLSNGVYSAIPRPIKPAPDWILATCRRAREAPLEVETPLEGASSTWAVTRATRYLLNEAPLAVKGQGGDLATYRVAATLKDFGVDRETALILMLDYWNDRTTPGWRPERLKEKVDHAFKYGQNSQGVADPRTQFGIAEPPEVQTAPDANWSDKLDWLNETYAYVAGNSGFVIHETKDEDGNPTIDVIALEKFHTNLASEFHGQGAGAKPLTKVWMASRKRRSYEKLVFAPEKSVPRKFYNLWRGFSVTPLTGEPPARARKALELFLTHIRENVCVGDETLFHWITAYFGHMIQKPWELPLISLVLRGKKGVGKNALIDRVGFLLGNSFSTVSNRRYLTSNFNAILENKVMLVLDEAFWSGDKQTEGVLKGWVTSPQHVIERKGHEHYSIKNCMRLIILANDEWAVPASADERRFAVFDVGEGKIQDTEFFKEIRYGLEANENAGYRLLLRHLQEVDISPFTVGVAPKTSGLLNQKIHGLPPIYQWWYDCLREGQIIGADFERGWCEFVRCDVLRASAQKEMKSRNIHARMPTSAGMTQELKIACPSLKTTPRNIDGDSVRVYKLPSLLQARAEWETYIGHKTRWETEDEDLFS